MNPDMFTPTLDLGNEWWTSLIWIAKAWAIAAVSTTFEINSAEAGPIDKRFAFWKLFQD